MAKLNRIFNFDNVAVFLSELLGTALLVFLACSGNLNWTGSVNILQLVLTNGLAVLIAVQSFGCVSGAHINPSITLAALVYKIIDFKVESIFHFISIIIDSRWFFDLLDAFRWPLRMLLRSASVHSWAMVCWSL